MPSRMSSPPTRLAGVDTCKGSFFVPRRFVSYPRSLCPTNCVHEKTHLQTTDMKKTPQPQKEAAVFFSEKETNSLLLL